MLSLNHFFLVFLVVSTWGFNNIVIKWGLSDLPPLFMTCMRFIVVVCCLIPFMKITKKQLLYFLPLSFTFGVMHFSCLFFGIKYTDAGTGAVLVQLGTPFSMLLAVLFLKEKLTIIKILGIIISILGVIVLIGSPTITNWRGFFLLLNSAIGWAISNMIIKRSPNISPLTMSGWIAIFATPVVGIASFFLESNQLNMLINSSWKGWFAILYSALASSIVAYSLWYSLLKKYPINSIIPYSLLTPVIAMIMGIVILEDKLNLFKIIGASFVIIGTAISIIDFSKIKFLKNKCFLKYKN